jgi:hypothetical protein
MPKRRFKSGALGARLVVRVVALLGWGPNWQDLAGSASQLSMRDEIERVVAHAVGAYKVSQGRRRRAGFGSVILFDVLKSGAREPNWR